MIDITLKLDKNHDVWKWLEAQDNKLLNAGHIGTHIDVYKKSSIPIDYFKSQGLLIDCTSFGINEQIGIEVVDGHEITEGTFIMFKTDIQTEHPYGSDVYINNHPELSWELIDHLLEKKVHFIGIDCAGIRRGKEHVKADVKSEENDTYVVENLSLENLSVNQGQLFDVFTMWIDNPFLTGLSTRIFIDTK